MIETLFSTARQHGFDATDVHARLRDYLAPRRVERVLVIEPERELGEIIAAELRESIELPVAAATPAGAISERQDYLAAALVSRVHELESAVAPGTPKILLRLRSVPDSLTGQRRPSADQLIAVASSSPEVLRRTRTVLIAAALDPDALEFRDAREDGWDRGLDLCHFVISDVITAARIGSCCPVKVLRVLPDSSVSELRALVTDRKLS